MLKTVFVLTLATLAAGSDTPYGHWPPDQRAGQQRLEKSLNAVPSPTSLRAYHDLVGTVPHVAGTPGDLAVADMLASEFESMGLEVEKQELWVYLARPVAAAVEIVSPVKRSLPLREDVLAEDKYSAHADLTFGWNAFSGNGDVTAPIVYANYGTKEDFWKLRELGVKLDGKIVIARYGGNYRGYKAKFAEAAGAVGLIIYTDPANSGYARGLMYPEGGYANPSSIQRGSIVTLGYSGDPLTPFVPATKDAKRLDPNEIALPRIPVQPMGWAAAREILVRMRGEPVPAGWQGGLPFTYRVTSGDGLRVRLMVEQKRELTKVYNVVGTLHGSTHPEQKVIVGCHHDAWGFGAGDPLAGVIVLLESAKSFATLARGGVRPARSIVFGLWAAEEFGIIGSVEWVEAHRDDLLENAVAYINLDMAAMGPNFGSSAAPVLQSVIASATRAVPVPNSPASSPRTVFDAWVDRSEDDLLPGHPRFGHLGGGSDHVGFYCHAAIPSASLGGGGAKGTAYHSNYDSLAWYRAVVGDDYKAARMVTRVTNIVLARLAGAVLLPIDPARYGPEFRVHVEALTRRAKELDFNCDFGGLEEASREYERKASRVYGELLNELDRGVLSSETVARVNDRLLKLERNWHHAPGLSGGLEWFKNLYAISDPDSGYAPWMLPALRWAIEQKDVHAMAEAVEVYTKTFASLTQAIEEMQACR